MKVVPLCQNGAKDGGIPIYINLNGVMPWAPNTDLKVVASLFKIKNTYTRKALTLPYLNILYEATLIQVVKP